MPGPPGRGNGEWGADLSVWHRASDTGQRVRLGWGWRPRKEPMNEQSPWEVGQVLQVPTSWGLGRGSVWLKGGDRESQPGAVSQVPVDRRTVDPWGGGTPSAGRPLAPQPSRKMLWDQAGGQRPWVLSQVWRRDARGRCLEEWGRMQKVCTWASGKRALQERPISSPSSPPSPTATFPSGSLAASIPSPTLFLQFLSGCFVCLGPPHGVWSSGPGIRSEPAAVAT